MLQGPDFICIGLQKAGTGWLYDQMAAAEGVWMPPIKEVNYLNGNSFKTSNLGFLDKRDLAIANGATESAADRNFYETFKWGRANQIDLEWYHKLFAGKGSKLSGDVSPEYAKMKPGKIALMARVFADCKYVLLLRDPVSRFWSAACMRVRQGKVAGRELEYWHSVSQILATNTHQAQSFPTRVWRKWSAVLPQDSLRYWFIEDIAAKPELVREEIYRFIGGSELQSCLPPSYNRKENSRKYAMNAEVRLGLAAYFSEEIQEAAELFGGHAVGWARENRLTLETKR